MHLPSISAKNLRALALGAVLLFAAAFRLSVFDLPFVYHPEGEGSVFALFARNLVRYDWAETRGMNVLTVGATPGEGRAALAFCPDHPPTTSWLIAICYSLFGIGEWQTRLPGALFTLGGAFLLHRLISAHGRPRAGPLAAALFLGAPMMMLFGAMPDVTGSQLTFCALLAVAAYLRFAAAPSGRRFAVLAGAYALATLVDWPAHFLGPVFALHFALTQSPRRWGWMVALGGVAVVLFAAMYAYIVFAAGAPLDWMWALLSKRTGLGDQPWTHGTGWWRTALEFNLHCHTLLLMLPAAAWIAVRGWRTRGSTPAETATRLLLAWAALHAAVGRQGIYVHEWWWEPLTPGLAAAAALALDLAWHRAELAGCPRRVAAALMVLCVAAFTAWSAADVHHELRDAQRGSPFTPQEVGEAIRTAAPQSDDVALVMFGPADPRLWYYGDRALKIGGWTIADFERRRADDVLDLPYDFSQTSQKHPTGFVVPLAYEPVSPRLLSYLRERFPERKLPAPLMKKFAVFDLESPKHSD